MLFCFFPCSDRTSKNKTNSSFNCNHTDNTSLVNSSTFSSKKMVTSLTVIQWSRIFTSVLFGKNMWFPFVLCWYLKNFCLFHGMTSHFWTHYTLQSDDLMNIHKTWDAGITGAGVTICVNDPTGVDYNHPELRRRFVSESVN